MPMEDEVRISSTPSDGDDADEILAGIAAAGILVGAGIGLRIFFDWLTGADGKAAEEHFQNARQYETAGDLQNAVREFYECLKLNKDHAEAHNSIAWILSTHRLEPDRAFYHASEAVRLAPQAAHCLDTLAEAILARGNPGDPQRAVDVCRRVLLLSTQTDKGTQFLCNFRIGWGYLLQDDLHGARLAFLKAEEINHPDWPYDLADVYAGLAVVMLRTGYRDHAYRYCRRSLEIRPGFWFAVQYLGWIESFKIDDAPTVDKPTINYYLNMGVAGSIGDGARVDSMTSHQGGK